MSRQRPIAGTRNRSRLGQPSAAAALPRPAAAPRPAPAAATGARRADVVSLVALLLAVSLTLTAGLLVLRARAEAAVERARHQGQASAESAAVDLLSYDYRHLDRDFARARRSLTGRFADDYAATTEKVVRPTAEQVHAVVRAEVAASSVVRASVDQVVVLLFIDQTTTSTRLQEPKVDLDRVRITLQPRAGRWLVSGVSAL